MLFDACACECVCTCVSIGRCVEEDAQSPVRNVILADTDNLLVLNSGMCGWTQMESCVLSVFPFGLFHPNHESSSNWAGPRHPLPLAPAVSLAGAENMLDVFFFVVLLSPV